MTATVEIHGLAKSFNGHTVLDHIDLAVQPGSTTAVVGSSGCGKTTLLRLIAGFEQPDAGTISIGGRQVASPQRSVPPLAAAITVPLDRRSIVPYEIG